MTCTAELLMPVGSGTFLDEGEGEAGTTSVAIRLETTDLAGVPRTQMPPGNDFYLQAWVQDVRPPVPKSGVFAAYLDITYDDDLLSVVSSAENPLGFDIEFGAAYENGISGDASTAGLLDEVGAFQTGFNALGASEVLLFRTRFSTGDVNLVDDRFEGIPEDPGPIQLDVLANDHIQVGTVQFIGSPADVRPLHDVVIYHPASIVPDNEVAFVDAELEILGAGQAVITAVGTPSAGGSVWIAGDGSRLVYQPAKDFFGTETFTYSVSGRTAEVTVVVDAVNDVPVGNDDMYAVAFEETLVVDSVRGVLANDWDAEGDLVIAQLVQQPSSGTVVLQPDGSFEYQPGEGFRGRDTFTYVIDDAQSLSDPVTVRIDVGVPQLQIRLQVTDVAGQEVNRVESGDSLYLRAWVQDVRDEYYENRGVFAAYLDVLYDTSLLKPRVATAQPLGFEIEFGPEFSVPGSGDVLTPGLVNEVGSFALSFEPLGTDEMLLFEMPLDAVHSIVADDQYEVRFQSTANLLDVLVNDHLLVWSTELVAESADESPSHDVLMYQPPAPVAEDQIVFTGASLELASSAELRLIGSSATVAGGTTAISPDGKQVVYSPPAGFLGTDSFTYVVVDPDGRMAEATVVVDVTRGWQNVRNPLDVNSDTVVSPIDALLVISELNRTGSRTLSEPSPGPPFIDVNGDGVVSPIDALLVISFLNGTTSVEGEGEGEGSTGIQGMLPAVNSRAPAVDSGSLVTPLVTLVEADDDGSLRAESRVGVFAPRHSSDSGPNSELVTGLGHRVDHLLRRWDRERISFRVDQAVDDLLQLLDD